MPITRERKNELVQELAKALKRAQAIILTDYRGMTVAELQALRNELRGMKAEYHVAKNTLLEIALKDAGLPVPATLLEGPTAVAFLNDDIAAPVKKLGSFFKDRERPLKGAIVGQTVYDAKSVEQLGDLPSRSQLLATLLGSLNAPSARTAGILVGSIRQVLNVLQARVKQLEEQSQSASVVAS